MQSRKLGREGPTVSAVAFGGMLLSISGRPPEEQALRVLFTALDNGISLIDTADAYCLDEETDFNHNERLIARALKQRRAQALVMTKVACRRPGGAWTVDARPEYLIEATHRCLKALGTETIDILQLHAPDSRVSFEDSVGALARLREQGKAAQIGLSNVGVEHIERARKIVPIVSVQNRWNPLAREVEHNGVLSYCTKHEIAFLAYSPFGGTLAAPTLATLGKLGEQARRRRVSPYRLVLAWMLAKSPWVIPIAGARRPESIADSAKASELTLDAEAIKTIEAALPKQLDQVRAR